MVRRRLIIGAIGGDRQASVAFAFGAAVARAGYILLTGGEVKRTGEVKDEALSGAAKEEAAGKAKARLVGIVKDKPRAWRRPSNRWLLLDTGLPHNERNVINGVTPDVLVTFGGSKGTLAEMAFATAARKPIFFFGSPEEGAVARLTRNLRQHFASGNECNVREYFTLPLNRFSGAWAICPTAFDLLNLLGTRLERARDWPGTEDALVEACAAAADARSLGPTGFPGLPEEAASKELFEKVILEISR